MKTWLISRIGQHRLIDFALLRVQKDIIASIDKKINKFAKMKKRKF
jgi:hypothetical protein